MNVFQPHMLWKATKDSLYLLSLLKGPVPIISTTRIIKEKHVSQVDVYGGDEGGGNEAEPYITLMIPKQWC